jgi:preprotein translocase subunit Sss1
MTLDQIIKDMQNTVDNNTVGHFLLLEQVRIVLKALKKPDQKKWSWIKKS